jgi:opacity protein-like surface antigen
MTKCVLPAACALALSLIPSSAAAQATTPLGGRLVISINGAVQPGDQNISSSRSFEVYPGPAGAGEMATVLTEQPIRTGGGLLDIAGAVRVTRNLGVGMAFTSVGSERGATMSGSIPHPIFFNSNRGFTMSFDGLEHRQRAVHLQAVLFVPFTERIDFMVSAGPTFFNVSQAFAGFDSFSEVGPPFNEIAVAHSLLQRDGTAVGFNVGADAAYYVTPMIGVGGMIRYTRGSVDFTIGEGQTVSIDAGNVQVGAGLRLRF